MRFVLLVHVNGVPDCKDLNPNFGSPRAPALKPCSTRPIQGFVRVGATVKSQCCEQLLGSLYFS